MKICCRLNDNFNICVQTKQFSKKIKTFSLIFSFAPTKLQTNDIFQNAHEPLIYSVSFISLMESINKKKKKLKNKCKKVCNLNDTHLISPECSFITTTIDRYVRIALSLESSTRAH